MIDDSLGEDEGEIDHLGRNAAVEYLLMPERVKKIENLVETIGPKVEMIVEDLSRVAGALSKLCTLEDLNRSVNRDKSCSL